MRRTRGIINKSDKMVELVVDQLVKNNKIDKKMPINYKRQVAAKALVDKFMTEEMKFTKEEWKNIEIANIHTGKRKDKEGNLNYICRI